MSKFVRKIALLFMVCGLAVSVSFGAMNKYQKENCEKAKAYRLSDERFNMCMKDSIKIGGWASSTETGKSGHICPIQKFIALCEFVEKNSPANDKNAKKTLEEAWRLNRDKKSEYYYHFGMYGLVMDREFIKAQSALTLNVLDEVIEEAEIWKEGKKWESYRNNAIGGVLKENAEALEGSRK